MRLSGGKMDCDDETEALTDQMYLRDKLALEKSQRMVKRLLHLRRISLAQFQRLNRVFFSPSRRLGGPDDGAIERPELVIDITLVVQFIQHQGDDTSPSAVRPPPLDHVKTV